MSGRVTFTSAASQRRMGEAEVFQAAQLPSGQPLLHCNVLGLPAGRSKSPAVSHVSTIP